MKALTLWQPWASLMALGHKKVETRIWQTKYREPIAIHSAQNLPPAWLGASRNSPEFKRFLEECLPPAPQIDLEHRVQLLPRGQVLCIVRLVAVVETSIVREGIAPKELAFGNYEDGRFAWFTEMIEVFEKPIPAKGNRMLWNWERP